jgi:hypothetical protein
VLAYTATVQGLVGLAREPADWAPLEEFVAVPTFQRLGSFLEVQDWHGYTEMLTRWASSIDRFETTVRRVSELPALVYYEIEERHFRGDAVRVVNSMTVFGFAEDARIGHLDVYLQQRPGGSAL